MTGPKLPPGKSKMGAHGGCRRRRATTAVMPANQATLVLDSRTRMTRKNRPPLKLPVEPKRQLPQKLSPRPSWLRLKPEIYSSKNPPQFTGHRSDMVHPHEQSTTTSTASSPQAISSELHPRSLSPIFRQYPRQLYYHHHLYEIQGHRDEDIQAQPARWGRHRLFLCDCVHSGGPPPTNAAPQQQGVVPPEDR